MKNLRTTLLQLRQSGFNFLVLLALYALIITETKGATITVTTAVDEVNGTTTSVAALIATPGGAGISLREAIIATNNTAGADVIQFAAALNGVPITLTRTGDDNNANNGDLDINDLLTITGNGANNTIIQGSSDATFTGSMGDKGFGINQDGTHLGLTVTITDLTIRWCRNAIAANVNFSQTGGGVDVFLTGTSNNITFTNCTITGNENVNGYGGGVNVDSGTVGAPGDVANNTTNRGTVTFTNCSITGNKVSNSATSAEGAGLNLYADSHNVTLTNCTVTGNTGTSSFSNGGGMNIRHSFGGTVTISGGTYSNNSAGGIGGGICMEGNQHITMSNATVNGNSSTNAASRGGGITVTCLGVAGFTANISISSTTITNNHADNGTSEGGGVYFNSAYGATLTGCTISGNSAKTGAGVQNAGGTTGTIILALSNCSVTNNSAATAGGGVSQVNAATQTSLTSCTVTGNSSAGNGGGVNFTAGTLTLDGVTISSNTADSDNNSSGDGGGIYHNGGTLNLNNTITVGSSGAANSAANGGGIANISGNLSKTSGLLTVANNTAKNNGSGLYITGGTINIQKANIINNTANSDNTSGGEGGGIYNAGGTLTLNFNRIALNVANGNTSSNALRHVSGTITTIQNNWWGTNNPATVINGTSAFTPYLQLTHTPGSTTLCPNISTGLTASFVNNSAGTNMLANIDRLIGLPITFGNATPAGSSISSPQTTIQANGTATATFNAGSTSGPGGADAIVDNFASSTVITVQAPPAITLGPVSQSVCSGNPVTFTSVVSGNPTPTGQWQVSTDGTNFPIINGATSTAYSFTAALADNSKQYRVVFTNSCGTATSNPATLTVYQPVTLTVNGPLSCTALTVTLTATGGFASYAFSAGTTQQGGLGGNTATVTTSGVYSVTANTIAGCNSTVSVTGSTTATPVSLTASSAITCLISTVTLTATPGITSYMFSAGAAQQGGPGGNTATVNTSGTYSVTATNASWCTSVATTTVISSTTLLITTSTSATTALVGSVVSLSATGGATYQWSSPPGALLTSPSTSSVVSASLISPGPQAFTVLVSQGTCSQTALVSVSASYTVVDLTATLLLDNLSFSSAQVGAPRDFIVSLSEVSNKPSSGTIAFKIAKLTAFTITYSTANGISDVSGGMANTNGSWSFSEDANYITVQTSATFAAFGNKVIGFSIARKVGIPANTVQSINITILPNAGNEQNFANNLAVTSVTAN